MPRPLLAQQQRRARRCTPSPAVSGGRCACSPTPRRCRLFCRGSCRRLDGRTRRCRSKPKNAPARISSAVSWRAAQAGVVSDAVDPPLRLDPVADDPLVRSSRQLALWPKTGSGVCGGAQRAVGRPYQTSAHSSISNSTQLNSARR